MSSEILKSFKKQNLAIKISLISDFLECLVISFVTPIISKTIYSDSQVTSNMIALSTVLSCVSTLIWNKVYSEKRRYQLFQKTYLFGMFGYAVLMSLVSIVTIHLNKIFFYWWAEVLIGISFGRLWSNNRMELMGNLFSTEERKSYERLQESLISIACLIGAGMAVFILNLSVWTAILIWCFSYFMDAGSMGFVFIYSNQQGLLKPRFDRKKL